MKKSEVGGWSAVTAVSPVLFPSVLSLHVLVCEASSTPVATLESHVGLEQEGRLTELLS